MPFLIAQGRDRWVSNLLKIEVRQTVFYLFFIALGSLHNIIKYCYFTGQPKYSSRWKFPKSSQEMLGSESRAASGRGSELLCTILCVEPCERHQRRPAARPHSAYRLPQFGRKIQPSNRVRFPSRISYLHGLVYIFPSECNWQGFLCQMYVELVME